MQKSSQQMYRYFSKSFLGKQIIRPFSSSVSAGLNLDNNDQVQGNLEKSNQQNMENVTEEIIEITEEDLTPVQAWCLFNEGYERAFTGNLHEMEEVGSYHCGACDSELFTSDQKLQDESGRPSFWYHKQGENTGVELEEFTSEAWVDFESKIDNHKIIPIHLKEPQVVPEKIKCSCVSS